MVGLHVERHKLGYYSGFALLVKKCYFYDFLQEFLQEIFSPNTHTFCRKKKHFWNIFFFQQHVFFQESYLRF